MPADDPIDDQIARLFRDGLSSKDIARTLGLKQAEVIGRIRALELEPPDPGAVRNGGAGTPEPESPPDTAPIGQALPPQERTAEGPEGWKPPEPAPSRRRSRRRTRPQKPADETMAENDDDEEDSEVGLVQLPGRPRGWLITEAELQTLFKRKGGRYEDVPLKRAQPDAQPGKAAEQPRPSDRNSTSQSRTDRPGSIFDLPLPSRRKPDSAD